MVPLQIHIFHGNFKNHVVPYQRVSDEFSRALASLINLASDMQKHSEPLLCQISVPCTLLLANLCLLSGITAPIQRVGTDSQCLPFNC